MPPRSGQGGTLHDLYETHDRLRLRIRSVAAITYAVVKQVIVCFSNNLLRRRFIKTVQKNAVIFRYF